MNVDREQREELERLQVALREARVERKTRELALAAELQRASARRDAALDRVQRLEREIVAYEEQLPQLDLQLRKNDREDKVLRRGAARRGSHLDWHFDFYGHDKVYAVIAMAVAYAVALFVGRCA